MRISDHPPAGFAVAEPPEQDLGGHPSATVEHHAMEPDVVLVASVESEIAALALRADERTLLALDDLAGRAE